MIADDVRTLIRQVERGNPFDVEWTGHAYDVRENMRNALAARLRTTALMGELEERIDRFARQSASTNMYMRLVIDDRMPDLPEYDPCNIAVFDGIRDSGTDFSKVIQRSTIYGTVMTSVNVTDLRAYFESGRKRHLLMYMGSDRDADIKALDKMMTALPTLMANAGVDAGTIKAVIEQIRSGGMTPEILKLVSTIVKIVELRAQPATPETKAEIQSMARDFAALMERALPALPPVFARAFAMVAVSPAGLAPVLPPAILPLLQDVVMKTSPVQSVIPSADVVARVPAAPQAPATRPVMRASFARVAEVPAVLNVPRIVLATPLKLAAPVRGDVVPATTSKTTLAQTAPATKSSGKIAAAIRAGFARVAAKPAVLNVPRIVLSTPLSLTVPVSNQTKSLSTRSQSQIQKTQAVLTKSIDAAPRTAPAGKIATMMRAAFASTASVHAVLNVPRLILSVPLRFDAVRKSEKTPARTEPTPAPKGTGVSRLIQNFTRTSIAPAVLNVAKLALSTPLRLVAAPPAMREVMPSARGMAAHSTIRSGSVFLGLPAMRMPYMRAASIAVVTSVSATNTSVATVSPVHTTSPAIVRRVAPAPANEPILTTGMVQPAKADKIAFPENVSFVPQETVGVKTRTSTEAQKPVISANKDTKTPQQPSEIQDIAASQKDGKPDISGKAQAPAKAMASLAGDVVPESSPAVATVLKPADKTVTAPVTDLPVTIVAEISVQKGSPQFVPERPAASTATAKNVDTQAGESLPAPTIKNADPVPSQPDPRNDPVDVPDCCKDAFRAVSMPSAAQLTTAEVDNTIAHQKITERLENVRQKTDLQTRDTWDRDLIEMTKIPPNPQSPSVELSGLKGPFGHVCGAGCAHDAKAGVPGTQMKTDMDVTLKAVAHNTGTAQPVKTGPAWLKQRTVRPA